MRVRFGGEGWQESSETEFERCFGTGHLSAGSYTIRVEADRVGGNWSNITSAEAGYQLTAQAQPTQPPAPPKGPSLDFGLSPSGGTTVGNDVNVHVKVYSSNPGAARIYVPCGGIGHFEHTAAEYDTTWSTGGCGTGSQTVRVCARDVNDPNWANPTCSERSYTLSSPPVSSPAPTANFWADATTIQAGQCTWLHWTTTNASQVDIDGEGVSASGDKKVCPTVTKHYSLKAQGSGGVATRSLSIVVSAQAPGPSVTGKFQTGDIIQIGYDVFVIVDGERRLVPNPDTLDALGIPRSWINNKGFSDSELKTIPRGTDIPDVNRDYSGFTNFKKTYFPNTNPIIPATATQKPSSPLSPTATRTPVLSQTPAPVLGTDTEVVPTPFFCDWPVIGWLACDLARTAEASSNLDCNPQCVPYARDQREDLAGRWWSQGSTADQILKSAETMPVFTDPNTNRRMQVRVRNPGEPPQPGDLVVWPPGCEDAWSGGGHLGYNTGNGSVRITDANWDNQCGKRIDVPISVPSCVRFITEPFPEGTYQPPKPQPTDYCSQYAKWPLRWLWCKVFGR